jgi:DNA-binding response OmpR family regulator
MVARSFEPGDAFLEDPRETILVVDDEPAMRHVMIRTLTHAGYSVLEASSGAEALALTRSFPSAIHLAIIDQTLGDSNGVAVAGQILESRHGIRVLLISGYLVDEDTFQGFPCLHKPFTIRVLREKIRQLLAPSNQSRWAGD